MKYAFSQLPLSSLTSIHCNFNILCGEATGKYGFKIGFYGLTDMPTEFQKAIEDRDAQFFVDRINSIETLKSSGGKSRSLSIQLRSGYSFFYSNVDTRKPVSFLKKRTCDLLLQRNP